MRRLATLGSLAVVCLWSGEVAAQAWVGNGGSLSTSIGYTYGFSDKIIYDQEDPLEDVPLTNHVVQFGVSYAPIDRLGVELSLPMVSSKIDSSGEGYFQLGRYDDGSLHTTFEDFRMSVRYQILEEILALSPHIGFSIPVTKYESDGSVGVARGLKSLSLGMSVGKYFYEGVPDLFLHGSFQYSFVERFETDFEVTGDHNQDTAEFGFQVGYFVNPEIEVHGAIDGRFTQGGIGFDNFGQLSPVEQYYYNSILKEQFIYTGLGASYQLTTRVNVAALARIFTWGKNTTNQKIFGLAVDVDVM